jgi:hypothetical protein
MTLKQFTYKGKVVDIRTTLRTTQPQIYVAVNGAAIKLVKWEAGSIEELEEEAKRYIDAQEVRQ